MNKKADQVPKKTSRSAKFSEITDNPPYGDESD
jgi:hypothetical protein